ncbi:hypothetical protein [Aquamicrobium defluvii]|uniref:O-antigen ligase-like membrane protein n=1 Tax=Aquamicrobium defluvii TaxID=69279 RepID=A0A4R6YF20_9HYPH|nr:hypothetical protein [Aquamicrobium defluvii]TDR34866.1 hypothetical protein DES43_11278 [Aquamicrobium defluvii]
MGSSPSWFPGGKLLLLAVALFPFYIFPSGSLQPSHFAFLLLSLVTIGRYGMPRQGWILLLLLFTGYAFLVEMIAGVIADNLRYLIHPAFFLFNFLLIAGVYRVVLQYGIAALRLGILAAALFAVISVYLSGVDLREMGEGGRPTGTFNNPNQLGFFSVCTLSLTYLLYLEKEIRLRTMLSLLATSLFLAIVSLSKAAIIANLAVLAFTLRPRRGGWMIALWIGLTVSGIVGVVYLASTGYFAGFLFYNRIINMGQEHDSSLVERGYLAFLEGNLFEIIFGMGSPEVHRIVGHEVHSTFASVWNTYGVVGFALFLPIFVIWGTLLNRTYGLANTIVLIGPAVLYGITHNGARFSIFWLLLAASMAMAKRKHFSFMTNMPHARPARGRGNLLRSGVRSFGWRD